MRFSSSAASSPSPAAPLTRSPWSVRYISAKVSGGAGGGGAPPREGPRERRVAPARHAEAVQVGDGERRRRAAQAERERGAHRHAAQRRGAVGQVLLAGGVVGRVGARVGQGTAAALGAPGL